MGQRLAALPTRAQLAAVAMAGTQTTRKFTYGVFSSFSSRWLISNSYICGTGEAFCGPSCISNCDYKAECNPGGWDPRYVASERCPLNVCCSTFGFCGVSRDFCGDREVPQPRCSENSGTTRKRRIAYYEGWSPGRPCDVMTPLQVPLGFYTHINVAFAFINPTTFRVEAMDGVPNDITRQIASLKGADPGLRVFISLGGWTFNDPGPTRFTFSQIAASRSAQEAFADSLISFMFHYNLDGVDIDWEYPGADDRGGIPADYANFVTWMNQLRNRLNRSGRKFEVTITVVSGADLWFRGKLLTDDDSPAPTGISNTLTCRV
jgi:chitinase